MYIAIEQQRTLIIAANKSSNFVLFLNCLFIPIEGKAWRVIIIRISIEQQQIKFKINKTSKQKLKNALESIDHRQHSFDYSRRKWRDALTSPSVNACIYPIHIPAASPKQNKIYYTLSIIYTDQNFSIKNRTAFQLSPSNSYTMTASLFPQVSF